MSEAEKQTDSLAENNAPSRLISPEEMNALVNRVLEDAVARGSASKGEISALREALKETSYGEIARGLFRGLREAIADTSWNGAL